MHTSGLCSHYDGDKYINNKRHWYTRHRSRVGSGGVVLLTSLLAAVTVLGVVRFHQTQSAAATAALQQATTQQTTSAAHAQTSSLPMRRVLLASHNRLAWYTLDDDSIHVLHEGEGVHYGMFPGSDGPNCATVWTALRPHNWRPTSTAEFLVELDAVTGEEVRRVQIPSRFTHDVVRSGSTVYVASTGDGSVLQLSYPGMELMQRMELFTAKDHPNTLAPLAEDKLWVMLHNLGVSDAVQVDPTSSPPRQLLRIAGVGDKAHGLVAWREAFIILDSDAGVLVMLHPSTGDIDELWQVPEGNKFLKGLAVIDDMAIFGVSTWAERSVRDDPNSHGELAAYDLVAGKLLWRRQVATAGLLNTIGAPHLGVPSTYKAMYVPELLPIARIQPGSEARIDAVMHSEEWVSRYPPQIAGYWSSGWPYLEAGIKATNEPWNAGLALPLFQADIAELKEFVLAMPEAMWQHDEQARSNVVMTGRSANMARFKPGVDALVLLFSDQDGRSVYKFPYYDYFARRLEPLLEQILGEVDAQNIIRLQLARMRGGGISDIRIHQDSGGYAKHAHRIHVPLLTDEEVAFIACPRDAADKVAMSVHPNYQRGAEAAAIVTASEHSSHTSGGGRAATAVAAPNANSIDSISDKPAVSDYRTAGCVRIPAYEGLVFELNNRVPHLVSNTGMHDRIHLVIDIAEGPHDRIALQPGTTCSYMPEALSCIAPADQSAA